MHQLDWTMAPIVYDIFLGFVPSCVFPLHTTSFLLVSPSHNMSCPTFKVSVGIPVFGLGFTRDNQLILGGGGGASRSGVKNKLVSSIGATIYCSTLIPLFIGFLQDWYSSQRFGRGRYLWLCSNRGRAHVSRCASLCRLNTRKLHQWS